MASGRKLRDSLITQKHAKELDERRAASRDWLNPISMSKLQRAVNEKKKDVVLDDGLRYNITYGIKTTSKITGEVHDSIKLKRADGAFVPFAYVSLKRIKEFDFAKGE
jgi:hypothetical protein